MFVRPTSLILRGFCRRPLLPCRSLASSAEQRESERDPAPYFFDWNVQKILKKLTRVDYERVFRHRKLKQRLEAPEYRFMTDMELEEAKEIAMVKARKILQIPPVVKARTKKIEPLSEDYALEGYETSKYVFTDISLNIRKKDRMIVVREPNGVLRKADVNETHRMNQIYFPIAGRNLDTPKMFYGEYFDDLLERGEYEFILDRACLQFEPDNPEYQTITEKVYEHVVDARAFNDLRSTRHFGALVFYLAWNNKIDPLLLDILNSGEIDEAVELVRLYHKIHPNANSATEKWDETDPVGFVTNYVNLDGQDKYSLKNSLQQFNITKGKAAAGTKHVSDVQQQDSDSLESDSSDSDSSDSDSSGTDSSELDSKPKDK